MSRRSRQDCHREQAEKAFTRARAVLGACGIPFTEHVRVSHKAPTMLDASVTSAVLDRTSVPVEVIAGQKLSALERYGAPAGIGAVILVFVLAFE